jgi:hypothetical protein
MEKNFLSPTTPGLKIDYNNYIIELVCLNVNRKLGPKFWSSSQYWKQKYVREIKGIHNLGNLLKDEFDLSIPVNQVLLSEIIKNNSIKCLLAKKTLERIKKLMKKTFDLKQNQYSNYKVVEEVQDAKGYMDKNSRFVQTGPLNKLQKLKRLENNG